MAMAALANVGVIRSEGAMSDLLQQGRHRLFGKEGNEKAVFANEASLQFWMGLVTLWSIGIHEVVAGRFEKKMKSFGESTRTGFVLGASSKQRGPSSLFFLHSQP